MNDWLSEIEENYFVGKVNCADINVERMARVIREQVEYIRRIEMIALADCSYTIEEMRENLSPDAKELVE